ncbi:MAG: NAD(P)-dependent oxidoreductase [Pseudopedobacter saltans]|uniref:NAD(P)-dependent oxidoreductase n=1 Tax=Pseudopedobacter saltans TaxID=151895 RepID=A0A2W5F0K6_9SPHI|nr:MAG: NAD(P)-dependent oxidoreductase [Pseudopedobacter saltans]
MKIAIAAATGQLGHLVVAKLKERTSAENLVALVRTPEKAKDLGIDALAFDYAKPETQVEALKGIDALLLISSNEIGQRETQHKNVINSAKKAGVKWIVYTSLLRADTSTLSLAPEHLATEIALKESGLAYTILRNGWYTENYTNSVPNAVKNGAFIGSVGDGKIASAAREDYAEAAAIVLTTEGNEGKTLELAGDTAYSLTELAAEISKQTGKNIPYNNLPEEKYAEILESVGLPAGLSKAIASWDVSASKGDLFDDGKVLSGILGHPTTPLADVVKKVLG